LVKIRDILELLDIDDKNGIGDIKVTNLNNLKNATKGEITFITDKKYIKFLENSQALAILTTKELQHFVPEGIIALIVDNPEIAMAKISRLFFKNHKFLTSDTFVGVYVGENVKIGKNCQIFPNVTIYPNTIIGNNVTIHAGAVIGSDGFGYAHQKDGRKIKIYHLGNVIIEDDVEIGANSCIDRATFGSTIIKKGTKVDNLVQIAHNVILEENIVIASQTGIAGSSSVGKNTILAAQVGISDHVSIASNVIIAARGGVIKDIKEPGIYAGFPSIPHKTWLKQQAKISRLLKTKE